MPKLKIDGREVEVQQGTNLIIAALKAGVYIPHYCYHPLLPVAAQCRMCLVKVEGAPKPIVAACNVTVDRDMIVDTKDQQVQKLREIVLELLLQHHPVDCPVCPRSGECDLQNFAYNWGPQTKRYDGKRRLKGWKRVAKNIVLFKERCVLCTRCVRFLRDYTKTGGIEVSRRGFASDLVIFPEKLANGSNYVGNIIDICPVGALVDEATSYLPRAWRMEKALTHCPMCERGCTVVVEAWKGKIVRVKTFDNTSDKAEDHLYSEKDAIQPAYYQINGIEEIGELSYDKLYTQDMIICDIGRWDWRKFFFPRDSNLYSLENGTKEKIDFDSAVKISQRFFDFDKKAILVTPYATNEEMILLKTLAQKSSASISLLPPIEGQEDGVLLKKVRAPNFIGGKNIIGDVSYEVLQNVEKGAFDSVLYYGMGSDKSKFSPQKIKSNFSIIIDLIPPEGLSGIFIPATIPYEKHGTYTFEGKEKRIYPVYKTKFSEVDLFQKMVSALER
ncbi:MAG: 2Fe-2S iron-sulfur cluster-binding protein [Candidatus Calescibacterium sp.]|nr:2Fe-2S iron-sulfur cluster-binding protein [Candidatus Calescibacterium sp.]MCX7733472.1 2Fe-2S iron-sulfur cluster-binding protein [bacterium]MDW8087453.1 2Fe-2S iron-sulfur cluster-binding protein [Candidatus Calescibacterium sp.]